MAAHRKQTHTHKYRELLSTYVFVVKWSSSRSWKVSWSDKFSMSPKSMLTFPLFFLSKRANKEKRRNAMTKNKKKIEKNCTCKSLKASSGEQVVVQHLSHSHHCVNLPYKFAILDYHVSHVRAKLLSPWRQYEYTHTHMNTYIYICQLMGEGGW